MDVMHNKWRDYQSDWKRYEDDLPFTGYVIRQKVFEEIKVSLGMKKVVDIRRKIYSALAIQSKSSFAVWALNLQTITGIENVLICEIILRLFLNVLSTNGSIQCQEGNYTATNTFIDNTFRKYIQKPIKFTVEDAKYVASLMDQLSKYGRMEFKFATQKHILRYQNDDINTLEIVPFDNSYLLRKDMNTNETQYLDFIECMDGSNEIDKIDEEYDIEKSNGKIDIYLLFIFLSS